MTNLEYYKKDLISDGFTKTYCNVHNIDEFITRETLIDWLCEEHQILDKEEKEYLSNVIRPFRNKVVHISKRQACFEEEKLIVYYVANCGICGWEFPYFKKDSIYKCMELDKEYTLEELGL